MASTQTITNGNKTNLSLAEEAAMETTSRLLAALVNEGLVLVTCTVDDDGRISSLVLRCHDNKEHSKASTPRIFVSLRPDTKYLLCPGDVMTQVISPELYPADIVGPVTVAHPDSREQATYRPEEVFDVVGPWICDNQQVLAKIRGELQNSADNQEQWLRFALSHSAPELGDPLIEWEQRCVRGHPTHPMHRSFFAIPPMKPFQIDDGIEKRLDASIAIISVPRTRIHLDGPFEKNIEPLLAKLEFARETVPADRVLIPCFVEQLPVIHAHFGTDAKVVPLKNKLHGQRQASMRTVSIPGFPLHVKMPLCCAITSAIRNVSPWTARMCIEYSQLLKDIAADPNIMPDTDLLWIARKTAAACSADADFEAAKHLSVLLREDFEPKARELGQYLILPVTLFERGAADRVPHVVRLFGLKTLEARKAWFRNYTRLYLKAVIPPLLSHGICLEAHLQNMLARFEFGTNTLRGFVYRDMGGLRMHVPTMSQRGVTIQSARLVPGAVTLTDDLDAVWTNAYHNFVVNHLEDALHAMGLAWNGGWDVLREELTNALSTTAQYKVEAAELLKFFLQPRIKRKAFLGMKIAGVYRTRVYCYLPNALTSQDSCQI